MKRLGVLAFILFAQLALTVHVRSQESSDVPEHNVERALEQPPKSAEEYMKLLQGPNSRSVYMELLQRRKSHKKLVESIAEHCWNSGNPDLMRRSLDLMPKESFSILRQRALASIRKENHRTLIIHSTEMLRGFKLTAEEFSLLLDRSRNLDPIVPGEMYHGPILEENVLKAGAASLGPDAYPLLQKHVQDHPDVKERLKDPWERIELSTAHPDAIRKGLENHAKADLAVDKEGTRILFLAGAIGRLAKESDPNLKSLAEEFADTMASNMQHVIQNPMTRYDTRRSTIGTFLRFAGEFPRHAQTALDCAKKYASEPFDAPADPARVEHFNLGIEEVRREIKKFEERDQNKDSEIEKLKREVHNREN